MKRVIVIGCPGSGKTTFAAVGLWVLYLIAWMAVIGWAGRCGSTPDAHKENKNPYSNKHI